MSISISALVQQTDDFEAQQLKEFEQFIDTSKKLKGALNTEQQQAEKNYQQMQSLVQSLAQPVPANGLAPIEVLESDASYVQALQSVNILPDDLNKPKVSIPYMDSFIKQVEEDMKQREPANE